MYQGTHLKEKPCEAVQNCAKIVKALFTNIQIPLSAKALGQLCENYFLWAVPLSKQIQACTFTSC